MKLKNALLFILPAFALVACGPGGGGGGGSKEKFTITIDGGGDTSNFNTTASMEKSAANPYPYNTLETLCNEYMEEHPNITIKVNKTSSNGDRATLTSQLTAKQSPDIIYQNGTVVNSDLSKDWYLDLTPYLEKENPYNGGKAWKEVYNAGELATTQAADGHYYYVDLEKIAVCFVYNKTLLNAAGVEHPENIQTFNQLLNAMEKLKLLYASDSGTYGNHGIYSTEYTWYQIAMEANFFGDLVSQGDVLRHNGMVDQEEMCRLFNKKSFDPTAGITDFNKVEGNVYDNNRYYKYINLIAQLDAYKAPTTFATRNNWALGALGFMEVTGNLLRTISAMDLDFEWGTIAFPDLTSENDPSITKGVVRGTAGLATSWWVSNHAFSEQVGGSTAKAEACVDLLMYLTSPAQNNRLIGDIEGAIPLNPTNDFELADYLKPLNDTYNEDIQDADQGNRVYWGSFNSWGVLGTSYQELFIRTMQQMDTYILNPATPDAVTPQKATNILAKSIRNTVNSLIVEYDYDPANW